MSDVGLSRTHPHLMTQLDPTASCVLLVMTHPYVMCDLGGLNRSPGEIPAQSAWLFTIVRTASIFMRRSPYGTMSPTGLPHSLSVCFEARDRSASPAF